MNLQRTTQPSCDDRGASLVEMSLLVALIALVCIGAVSALGTSVSQNMSTAEDGLGGSGGGGGPSYSQNGDCADEEAAGFHLVMGGYEDENGDWQTC